jgi:adrenodoxin-NADP+ reductase
LNPNLEIETAVIIGHGNVALDICRILLNPIKSLEKTDINSKALKILKNSKIKKVHVIGRRGPIQSSFTPKEIREIMSIENLNIHIDKERIIKDIETSSDYLSKNRLKSRLLNLLLKSEPIDNYTKELFIQYESSPAGFTVNENGLLTNIILTKNELNGIQPDLECVNTFKFNNIDCGLVVKCIGYNNGIIDDNIPFDSKLNKIPNDKGRVLPVILILILE